MFAKTIVLSDAFLDMPLSARCLYFTLGMLADDDGFINNPKSIMRQCGASDDDMKILLAKKFILAFETGVIVIKHWRINNLLRSDRYQPTKYSEEKKQLQVEENGAYTLGIPSIGIPSIDKDSIDKISVDEIRTDTEKDNKQNNVEESTSSLTSTDIPTQEEVIEYVKNRNSCIDPYQFYEYYKNTNWTYTDSKGKEKKVKNWKNKLLTWESHSKDKTPYFTNSKNNDKTEISDIISEVYKNNNFY